MIAIDYIRLDNTLFQGKIICIIEIRPVKGIILCQKGFLNVLITVIRLKIVLNQMYAIAP